MNNNKLRTNQPSTRWDTSKVSREARKANRKIIKAVRHKLLMHMPLSDEDKMVVVNEAVTAGCGIDRAGNVRHSIMNCIDAEDLGIDTTDMSIKEIYNALTVVEGMESVSDGLEGNPSYMDTPFRYMEKVVELSDDRIVVASCRLSEHGCNFLTINEYIDKHDLETNKITY